MKYIELLSELTKKADEYDCQRPVENVPNVTRYVLDVMRRDAALGKSETNFILEDAKDGKLKFGKLELDSIVKEFEECGFKTEAWEARNQTSDKFDNVIRVSWPRIYKHEE